MNILMVLLVIGGIIFWLEVITLITIIRIVCYTKETEDEEMCYWTVERKNSEKGI